MYYAAILLVLTALMLGAGASVKEQHNNTTTHFNASQNTNVAEKKYENK